MSARVLLSGVLFRAPTRKTSKNGNAYVFATIREGNGDAARWWKAFFFHDSAIEAVERLSEGEAVAVSGTFEAKIYTPEGKEARIDLSLAVDAVLSLKPAPRERKSKADKAPQAAPTKSASGPAASRWDRGGPNDDLPF
jgi:single-stranded DNA-binding protein